MQNKWKEIEQEKANSNKKQVEKRAIALFNKKQFKGNSQIFGAIWIKRIQVEVVVVVAMTTAVVAAILVALEDIDFLESVVKLDTEQMNVTQRKQEKEMQKLLLKMFMSKSRTKKWSLPLTEW